jgi:hypothetical protein
LRERIATLPNQCGHPNRNEECVCLHWPAAADAIIGSYPVAGIQLVTDAGYAFPTSGQVVQIDNTQINGITYTYGPNSPEDCKNGGWQNFTFAPGPFKNQGQGVSYFEHQKNQDGDVH